MNVLSPQELRTLHQEWQAAGRRYAEQRRKVIEHIRELMEIHGIRDVDLVMETGRVRSRQAYMHPETKESWSGWGQKPRWLVEACKTQPLEMFAVQASA
ncbi:DNA-binding protein H-NS [Roseateles asaccharophilus]|uniref:hypothetical protein n=1 Tax=Roseateles asaccharophilus TaxID=582607 RepID=UPI0038341A89